MGSWTNGDLFTQGLERLCVVVKHENNYINILYIIYYQYYK